LEARKQSIPRGVSQWVINQGNAKVFGGEDAMSKPQELCNVALDLGGCIEEENLIFGEVDFHTRSIAKKVANRENAKSFSNCGYSHEEYIIHELTVRDGGRNPMGGETG
jgi:hypothetical protein